MLDSIKLDFLKKEICTQKQRVTKPNNISTLIGEKKKKKKITMSNLDDIFFPSIFHNSEKDSKAF